METATASASLQIPPPDYRETKESDRGRKEMRGGERKRKRTREPRAQATASEPTASSPEARLAVVGLKPCVWRDLPPDLMDKVLTHLPVRTLWDTVTAIDPARWLHTLQSSDGSILGHGNHVDSSMGFIKSYTSSCRPADATCMPDDGLRPHALRVFEHTTKKWQSLPRFPLATFHFQMWVQSVSEGLLLLVSEAGPDKKLVVWNPVSQSHRSLPRSPMSTDFPVSKWMEALVVDRERKGYMVLEFTELLEPRVRAGPSAGEQREIYTWSIYDSRSGTWKQSEPPESTPKNLLMSRFMVSCEGCVCFVIVEPEDPFPLRRWQQQLSLVCYDPFREVWGEVILLLNFFEGLGGMLSPYSVEALLYASGRLYVVSASSEHASWRSYYVVSILVENVLNGIPAFEQRRRVMREELKCNSEQHHSVPRRCRSKPHELVLHRSCAHLFEHRWYMLPVAGTWYLCVLVCGQWHRRFDLQAQIWTDVVIQAPSELEHDQAVQMTVTPNGSLNSWCTDNHPYVPSWLNV